MSDQNYDNGDDFDGFFDSTGRKLRLVIQSPSDMLPPVMDAQTDRYRRVYRSRSRF